MDAHITDTLVFWLAVVGASWLIGMFAVAMCRAGKREDERLAELVGLEHMKDGEAA